MDLELRKVERQLMTKGVLMNVTDLAKDWLGEKGYDQVFGARPLRRVIQDTIEDRLSEMLLAGEFVSGDTIFVDRLSDDDGGGLTITTAKEPAPVA